MPLFLRHPVYFYVAGTDLGLEFLICLLFLGIRGGEILLFLIIQSRESSAAYHNVEGRMDWITLDSVIFAPVILYLENWINIEMDPSHGGAFL